MKNIKLICLTGLASMMSANAPVDLRIGFFGNLGFERVKPKLDEQKKKQMDEFLPKVEELRKVVEEMREGGSPNLAEEEKLKVGEAVLEFSKEGAKGFSQGFAVNLGFMFSGEKFSVGPDLTFSMLFGKYSCSFYDAVKIKVSSRHAMFAAGLLFTWNFHEKFSAGVRFSVGMFARGRKFSSEAQPDAIIKKAFDADAYGMFLAEIELSWRVKKWFAVVLGYGHAFVSDNKSGETKKEDDETKPQPDNGAELIGNMALIKAGIVFTI